MCHRRFGDLGRVGALTIRKLSHAEAPRLQEWRLGLIVQLSGRRVKKSYMPEARHDEMFLGAHL